MASGQPPGTDPLKPWTNSTPALPAEQQSQTTGNGQPPFGNQMVLTDEERQVLKECESESFFKRALPLSFGAMFGAQMLVKSGRWSANPKYGALPKALVCGGIGYFIGKIMYLPQCQEKILNKIPNSNLAAQVRKSKGLPEPENQIPDDWDVNAKASQPNKKLRDEYSYSYQSPELEERFRPSVDREVKTQDEEPEEKKNVMTYDELRKRNRQEYEDSISKKSPPSSRSSPSYKDSVLMPKKPWPEDESKISEAPATPAPTEPPQRKKRTNMWGDPIDE